MLTDPSAVQTMTPRAKNILLLLALEVAADEGTDLTFGLLQGVLNKHFEVDAEQRAQFDEVFPFLQDAEDINDFGRRDAAEIFEAAARAFAHKHELRLMILDKPLS